MLGLRPDRTMAATLTLLAAQLCALCLMVPTPVIAADSGWSTGKSQSRARLLTGYAGGKPMAAVEIELADGWKTYWRMPGDAGGVPPGFDWTKSANLASTRVLYPAPQRYEDKTGITLGYKHAVVFPVEIVAKVPGEPVNLTLTLEYGICREICVPVEAELTAPLPSSLKEVLPAEAASFLDKVPRSQAALGPSDPKFVRAEQALVGEKPTLAIVATFPAGATNLAAYLEGPDGSYLPLPSAPVKLGADGSVRFPVDMTAVSDLAGIRGKDAKVTLVSDQGLSEATFTFE